MPACPTVDDLVAVGLAAGLDRVGVADASPFDDTRRDLEERRAAGLHGGMQFTYRNPARSTEPDRILAGARALVVGARAYPPGAPDRPSEAVSGRVARYAAGDHYGPLRAGLGAVAAELERAGWRARVVADDNALVDRAAAHRAGIGWFGKNANLLAPGLGSWFVLGSVVTDAPLPPAAGPQPDGCGPCHRCLDACPTGAIVAPGVVDARRCLAWLLQDEGDFPEEHRAALGDRLYGCDDCQEVCPPGRPTATAGPAATAAESWVDLLDLLESDDEALLARHGRWYIPRRDPRYLRRNALVALGNAAPADPTRTERVLDRYRHGDDELLARHASWAARRLAAEAVR